MNIPHSLLDPFAPSSGVETCRMEGSGGGQSPATGVIRITYFKPRRDVTIARVLQATTGTAAAATPTLIRMGVYSVAANGDLTQIAATVNDTTLFAAANTEYTKAFSASASLRAGQWYAYAYIIVTGVAVPSLAGLQIPATPGFATGNRPRRSAAIFAKADLYTPIPNTDLGASSTLLYAALTA